MAAESALETFRRHSLCVMMFELSVKTELGHGLFTSKIQPEPVVDITSSV